MKPATRLTDGVRGEILRGASMQSVQSALPCGAAPHISMESGRARGLYLKALSAGAGRPTLWISIST
jgi:hypothetical protein